MKQSSSQVKRSMMSNRNRNNNSICPSSLILFAVSNLLASSGFQCTSVRGLSLSAAPTITTRIPDHQEERSVTLPLLTRHHWRQDEDISASASGKQKNNKRMLHEAFESIVDNSEFLERVDPIIQTTRRSTICMEDTETPLHISSCRIPVLSDDILIDFYLDTYDEVNEEGGSSYDTTQNNNRHMEQDDNENFVLKVSGASLSDFGWICTKFYQERDVFDGLLGTDDLRKAVASHHSRQPPCPGFAASSSAETPQETKSQQDFLENLIDESHLKQLEEQGYVVLEPRNNNNNNDDESLVADNNNNNNNKSFHVSDQSQQDMSQYLIETTGDDYRSDKVHFLTHQQAMEAGIGEHYKMLMSIATYLNANLKFQKSNHNPIAPATVDEPLTIPRMIQLAQYSQGDYYVAHSDNSYKATNDHTTTATHQEEEEAVKSPTTKIRNNFRHYTCILYCNDLNESDGGALRLYLNSQELQHNINKDAAQSMYPYVDIIPKNGRLLIFDSTLVHSVEKVLHPTKLRRALTLWILRPNDCSGITGETYY